MDVQSSTLNATAMEGLNTLRMVGSAPINDGVGVRTIETRIVSIVVLWNNQAVKPAYPTGLSKVLPPSQLSTTGFPCESVFSPPGTSVGWCLFKHAPF
jgi:hypothetical protein